MIFIWDNGEELIDHSVWFVESDLDPVAIENLLNAAVNPFSRRGGVIAMFERGSVVWKQNRVEMLETWFTYYGDTLVSWRSRNVHGALAALPKEVVRSLATCLCPTNAAVVNEQLGLDRSV